MSSISMTLKKESFKTHRIMPSLQNLYHLDFGIEIQTRLISILIIRPKAERSIMAPCHDAIRHTHIPNFGCENIEGSKQRDKRDVLKRRSLNSRLSRHLH